MKKIIKTCFIFLLMATSCKKDSNIVNADDAANSVENTLAKYSWIKIGTQKWMDTNLNTTHYRNGDRILQVKDQTKWAKLTTGAWCWYNNDSVKYAIYGRLYNWYAVNDARGLAPVGSHIPSDAEWNTLSTFLGGNSVSGGKMKEKGTKHWIYSTNATNSSGFTALGGGYRLASGQFDFIKYYGIWWSSTQSSSTNAWGRYASCNYGTLTPTNSVKAAGFSIRCIKD